MITSKMRKRMNPYRIAETAIQTSTETRNQLIVGILMTIFILVLLLACGKADTTYSTLAGAFQIDTENNETIFIDGAGYLWAVRGTNYKIGDQVELYFNNNCTDYTREDDVIIKIKRVDD